MFREPALEKAKVSVDKAENFRRREKMFVCRQVLRRCSDSGDPCVLHSRRMVEEILVWCKAHVEWRRHGLLFLFAYSFLLRVPSEALPVVAGPENYEGPSNAWLFREGADKLVLRLRRRKNKPGGSRLVRKCCCSKSKASCVVCLVGPLLDIAQPGQSLFKNISAQGEWHSVMPAVPVVRVRASRRR